MPSPTRIALIGSTGSIGESVLKVVDRYPNDLKIESLGGGSKVESLAAQARRYHPSLVAIADSRLESGLKELIQNDTISVLGGTSGIESAASVTNADTAVIATVGFSGVRPTLSAIRAGKRIALANKETLVAAGSLVTREAEQAQVEIAPIDSEHSAIAQCLRAGKRDEVRRLILTASGGPFRNRPLATFDAITPTEALSHPTWRMGPRITIDSATMMNKGFEIIEAAWLFGVPPDRIDVVIHPQSIVHSMVEFRDGSVVAQLGIPDMTAPITYALLGPQRIPMSNDTPRYQPSKQGPLEFFDPDANRYPALAVAREAFSRGAAGGAVLNAADEVAVDAFLHDQIPFHRIISLVESVLNEHRPVADPSIDDIEDIDRWARGRATELTRAVGSRIITS